jgi:hypothetical protein
VAVYDFRCGECGTVKRDIVLPITHRNSELPRCCDKGMNYHITSVPQVVWKDPQIEPFRFSAVPGNPLVTTTKQRRELMERHDLVDANDMYPPPTQVEQMAENAEALESVKAITPTAEQNEQLQKAGLDSIID